MRIYVVPRTGDGSEDTPFAPSLPDGISWSGYPQGEQFLVISDADLTALPGVTELTGEAITAACDAWGIDRAALGEVTP